MNQRKPSLFLMKLVKYGKKKVKEGGQAICKQKPPCVIAHLSFG